MVEYRDVVEKCYSSQSQLSLRQRVPKAEVLEITGVVLLVLEPIMKNCFLNQKRKRWVLSEYMADIANIHMKRQKSLLEQEEIRFEDTVDTFEFQLNTYKKNLCQTVADKLEKF